nr:MAG TPA: hypothetical protein [Caudoviricetes sp.]
MQCTIVFIYGCHSFKLWRYTIEYRYTIDIYKYHKNTNLSNFSKNQA